ncbi:putative methyltransferase [Clostridium sp. CAG:793]|nr:putative methyltransferase [Clostridium sp. CAG:793]
MRVISGKARGTKLSSIESLSTRPTLDRVKESLFNIIQNNLKGAVVLDLFAGSGQLGIEALSRDADKAYLCDINRDAVKMIKQNLEKTKLKDKAVVINEDYKKALRTLNTNEKFDIIFIDPPYKEDIAVDSIIDIIHESRLKENGIMIIETDEIERDLREINKIENIKIIDQRKYGRASLIFIKEA